MTNIYIFATSFKVGVINGYSTFSKLHRIFFLNYFFRSNSSRIPTFCHVFQVSLSDTDVDA